MQNKGAIPLMLAFASGLFAQVFPNTCSDGGKPRFPSLAAAAIDFCGLSGSFGATTPDGLQNQVKNNFCAPGAATSITISDLKAAQGRADKTPGIPKGSPPASRASLKPLGEGRIVVFEGFLFRARQECGESVNC